MLRTAMTAIATTMLLAGAAIAQQPAIRDFLRQTSDQATPYEQTVAALLQLFGE